MRCGIPAKKTSSAERGEFGKTSARSNFSARSFLPTEKIFSAAENEMISSTAGWLFHKSFNFSGVSSAMCAAGNFSRSRKSAGAVMTASPSQFTPRTKMRRGGGLKTTLISVFPAAMHPEPVRGVAPHGFFQNAVYVAHDGFAGTWLAIFMRGNFLADFDPPLRQGDTITNRRV